MGNVVTLHGDKRWKATIDYRVDEGVASVEHYFEEISELHLIIEHGPDWNLLIRCVVTLNRPDDGEDQNSVEKALLQERNAFMMRQSLAAYPTMLGSLASKLREFRDSRRATRETKP
jgi:hypothetical protein